MEQYGSGQHCPDRMGRPASEEENTYQIHEKQGMQKPELPTRAGEQRVEAAQSRPDVGVVADPRVNGSLHQGPDNERVENARNRRDGDVLSSLSLIRTIVGNTRQEEECGH